MSHLLFAHSCSIGTSFASYRLIQQKGLADVLDLGDGAPQIERFRQYNLEDLWEMNNCVSPSCALSFSCLSAA